MKRVTFLGVFVSIAFFAWLALTARVPMTYDEGWNWFNVASLGMKRAYLSYDAPNNHTLFSMLQSLLPNRLVTSHPAALRLINLVVGAALGGLLTYELKDGWVVSGVLLASPLSTLYLAVARGYLLGAALVLAGSLLMGKGRNALAGVCVVAAACVVPTFALVAPGLALFSLFFNGDRRGAVVFAGLVGVFTTVFYLPKLRIIAGMLHLYNQGLPPHELLLDTARLLGNTVWLSVALCISLLVGLRFASPGPARRVAICLASCCLSYFGCVSAMAFVGSSNPPFLRNGMFVPLFLWVAMAVLASACPRRIRIGLITVLLVNGVFGLLLIARCFVGSAANPLNYPGLAGLSPVPGRQIVALPVARMKAGWAAIPAGRLYANKLNVPLIEDNSVSGQCIIGKDAPEAIMRISIETVEGREGVVCF